MYGDEEEDLAAKSEDPVMRKIWDDKVGTVDINVKKVFLGTHAIINWVSKLDIDLSYQKYSFFIFEPFQVSGIEAIALSEFSTSSGEPPITINDKPLFPRKPHTWLFNTFNPWQPKFSEFILKCHEAGLVYHFKDETKYKARFDFLKSDKEKNVVNERPSIHRLSFEDLQVKPLIGNSSLPNLQRIPCFSGTFLSIWIDADCLCNCVHYRKEHNSQKRRQTIIKKSKGP